MKIRVAVLGATGETGTSIVEGLLGAASLFDITALTRQSSLQAPDVLKLQTRGVQVAPIDLAGSTEEIAKAVAGFDVVISAISAVNIQSQTSLIDAVKKAGVKRFVPCCFAPIMPPQGILALRDKKEHVLNYMKTSKVPYTIIDIGFWYQIITPHVPSGRNSYVAPVTFDRIVGDGNTPSGYTDVRDIGKWVARIVADPRTLNKAVFAFNAVLTTNQVYETLERVSGETMERNYITAEEVAEGVRRAEEAAPSPDHFDYFNFVKYQYWNSLYLRGDNTPEYGEYLGYVDARKLYPDLAITSFEEFCRQSINGEVPGIYAKMVAAAMAAAAAAK